MYNNLGAWLPLIKERGLLTVLSRKVQRAQRRSVIEMKMQMNMMLRTVWILDRMIKEKMS